MQTFRISKTQEQSYYAIRIFGIVHLLGAIGLIVLLDGPGDGLHGFSWGLIALLLLFISWLTFRTIQAVKGRIHGHFVLTRDTLAIQAPQLPRVIVHRKDCAGIVPSRRVLVLHDGTTRRLSLPGLSREAGMLSDAMKKQWWPEVDVTPSWINCIDNEGLGEVMPVAVVGRVRGRAPVMTDYPMLRYRPVRYIDSTALVLGALLALISALTFLLIAFYAGLNVTKMDNSGTLWVNLISLPLAIAASSPFLLYLTLVLRELFFKKSWKRAFVLTRRTLATVSPGGTMRFLHCKDALDYAPAWGIFRSRDLIPYAVGSLVVAPGTLIYLLSEYWNVKFPIHSGLSLRFTCQNMAVLLLANTEFRLLYCYRHELEYTFYSMTLLVLALISVLALVVVRLSGASRRNLLFPDGPNSQHDAVCSVSAPMENSVESTKS